MRLINFTIERFSDREFVYLNEEISKIERWGNRTLITLSNGNIVSLSDELNVSSNCWCKEDEYSKYYEYWKICK